MAAARAVAPDKRKGRVTTTRPSTKLLGSNIVGHSTQTLRFQQLSRRGIFGARAELLAVLAWGEANA